MSLSAISSFLKSVQAIVSFAVTLGALIAAGVLGYQSLADKPTRKEVELQVSKVQEQTHDLQASLDTQKYQIARVMRVQSFQIEQANWQSEVLDHIAQKQKGPVPPRSPRLKQLRAELLSAQ